MDSLPPELILEIFSFIVHGSGQVLPSPIILAHVSTRWRAIALRTNSLWTSIVLVFPYSHADIQRIQFTLARSQSLPLDIYLDLRDEGWEWDWMDMDDSHPMQAVNMVQIFDIVSPDAHRWRSVDILTDNWQPIHAFLALSAIFTSLPALESLTLSRCNAYFGVSGVQFEPAELRQPIELFNGNAHLPKLRHAVFAGVHVNWSRCGLEDLLLLELKYLASNVQPTMNEFFDIIRASPDIESLSLVGCIPHYDEMAHPRRSPDMRLCLPRLRKFSFGWSHIGTAVEFVSILQLPALDELYLEDVMSSLLHQDTADSSAVIECLINYDQNTTLDQPFNTSRAFFPLSNLRKLVMEAVQTRSVILKRLFEKMHNLEELEIGAMSVGLLGILAVDGLLCPKLKRMIIRYRHSMGYARYWEFFLERIMITRPLLQVEMEASDFSAEMEDLLADQMMVEDGEVEPIF